VIMDGFRRDGACYRSIAFWVVNWSEFYPDTEEAIPQDAPELRRVSVVTSCFVDSDHAGCQQHGGPTLVFSSL
jgi:hypothetical protein